MGRLISILTWGEAGSSAFLNFWVYCYCWDYAAAPAHLDLRVSEGGGSLELSMEIEEYSVVEN